MAGQYVVKCDDCKVEIRRTDNVRESFEGGFCPGCKEKAAKASARAQTAMRGS